MDMIKSMMMASQLPDDGGGGPPTYPLDGTIGAKLQHVSSQYGNPSSMVINPTTKMMTPTYPSWISQFDVTNPAAMAYLSGRTDGNYVASEYSVLIDEIYHYNVGVGTSPRYTLLNVAGSTPAAPLSLGGSSAQLTQCGCYSAGKKVFYFVIAGSDFANINASDLSDPANPPASPVATYRNELQSPSDMHARANDTHLLINNGRTLYSYSLTDPLTPVLVDQVTLPHNIRSLTISEDGNTIYTVDNVKVTPVDVTDGAAIAMYATSTVQGSTPLVVVEYGGFLWITWSLNDAVEGLDISNKNVLTQTAWVVDGTNFSSAQGLVFSEDIMFVSSNDYSRISSWQMGTL